VSDQSKSRVLAIGPAIAAVIVLFGCAAPGPPSSPAPTTSAGPSTQPSQASPSSPADSSSAAAAGSVRRPSINTLRTALESYFRDDKDLPADKAEVAADCAVYPTYQELSPASLKLLVNQDAADLTASEQSVFGDVVTECVTSAVG
jgi:hypothetical protein